MTISARNFPLLQIILCIPSYSVVSFFKEYHNSKVKINKMVNEQCVTYRPSPYGFTSKIFLLMSLYTPQCFISQKIFVQNFQSNLYIPLQFSGIPKFVVFQLRENAPVSQRIESRYRQWKLGREGGAYKGSTRPKTGSIVLSMQSFQNFTYTFSVLRF